jgi:hypothetical protein
MNRVSIPVLALGALGAGLMLAADALGQAQSPPAARPDSTQTEEITVTGRQLNKLYMEVRARKEDVYKAFNEHNNDHQLDIHCYDEVRYFSHSRAHTCRPVYIDVATGKAGQEFMRAVQMHCNMLDPVAISVLQTCNPAELDAASHSSAEFMGYVHVMNEHLDAEMQRLARESPEVAAAIAAYDAKVREYDDARAKKSKKGKD